MSRLLKKFCGKLYEYIYDIQERGDALIIRFKGAIDAQTIPCIQLNLKDTQEEYLNKNVIADFKEVTHVDTATFAAIVLLLNALKLNHRKLGIINVDEVFLSHLKIDHLQLEMKIFNDEQDALAELG